MSYQQIVVGLGLSPASDMQVMAQAVAVARKHEAKLTLVHAIEQLHASGLSYGLAAGVDVDRELEAHAQQRMTEAADLCGYKADTVVLHGAASQVLASVVDELKADLIVLGAREQHGWRRLLGSTAHAVMHKIDGDVLAVNITASEDA